MCLTLSLISYLGHFDDFGSKHEIPKNGPIHDEVDESFFKNVNYYSIYNSRPFLELESNELSLSSNDGVVIGFYPKGIIYRYDKAGTQLEPIYFQSKNSRALTKSKDVYLTDEVEIKMTDTNLHADKVSILKDGELINANQHVKTLNTSSKNNDQILVNANSAIYRPREQYFEYRENVEGIIKRKRLYEESLSFKSDLMTVEGSKSLASMTGNVSFKKDNLEASANRGEVFLENYNKRLKYYALYDDVRLQERLLHTGKPLLRKAFAEKLEGLISDKKIILTGLPKVFQEKDTIKGNRIIIRENVETVEVDDANTNITLKKEQEENSDNNL